MPHPTHLLRLKKPSTAARNVARLLLFVALVAAPSWSQPGSIDTSLAPTGGSPGLLQIGSAEPHFILGVDADSQNRILVGLIIDPSSGSARVEIRRYLEGGTLDTTFATQGVYVVSEAPTVIGSGFGAVLVGPGDSVYVAYSAQAFDYHVEHVSGAGVFVAKRTVPVNLVTNGLDLPLDMALCGNRIAVVGWAETASATDAAIAVLVAGTLAVDTGFNATGLYTVGFNVPSATHDGFRSVACSSSGYIAAGGSGSGFDAEGIVVSFKADGNLDSAFSSDGIQTYRWTSSVGPIRGGGGISQPTRFTDILVDAQDRIFASATVGLLGASLAHVVAIESDGSLRMTFGQNGWQAPSFTLDLLPTTDEPIGLLEGADNTIIMTGLSQTFSPDNSGLFVAGIDATSGFFNSSFAGNGAFVHEIPLNVPAGRSTAMDSDGRILLAGDHDAMPQLALVARFRGNAPVFADGFESGGTGQWSATVP